MQSIIILSEIEQKFKANLESVKGLDMRRLELSVELEKKSQKLLQDLSIYEKTRSKALNIQLQKDYAAIVDI